jgi:hypothetical protein
VNSDLLHLQTSQQGIAQLSNEERIDWIRQERWIQYPRAKRILERQPNWSIAHPATACPAWPFTAPPACAKHASFKNSCATIALTLTRN